VGFLSHCGSRGFGHALATGQFRALQQKFATWDIPLPGQDEELVYAPLRTPEAEAYLDDMAPGANFATVNHRPINALVIEAFQEVIPGVNGSPYISSATTSRARNCCQTATEDLAVKDGCIAKARPEHSRRGPPP